jgi:hypothetical protein
MSITFIFSKLVMVNKNALVIIAVFVYVGIDSGVTMDGQRLI